MSKVFCLQFYKIVFVYILYSAVFVYFFSSYLGYIRHHEVMHGDFPANIQTGPVHLCDECPKIYLKQRTLEIHKRRVHR